MLTAKAKKLLERVAREIEAEPLRIDMSRRLYHGKDLEALQDQNRVPACGIVGCIGGWICILSGQTADSLDDNTWYQANEILGMDEIETETLFYVDMWPYQFQGERVAPFRAIQGDDRSAAFVGDIDIHKASLARARSSFLRILPVAVRGSGPNSTCLGHLKCDSRERHHSINSSSVAAQLGFNPT